MSKGTTIKEAIFKWEEKHEGKKASETHEVKLYGQLPPIEKMDAFLSSLANCEHLSLSTNSIEKIANLSALKHLKVLSLGRNNIKNLTGLEAIGDTLLELWISYNQIEKLKGVNVLKKLKVLYISNNNVKDMNEVNKLADVPELEDLVMVGNPIQESMTNSGNWDTEIKKKLKKLKKLDGIPIIREETEE